MAAAAAATAVPSAPLFPFQEAPGKAEPGNQEVPRRDTSCRRRYGNGPRLPQGGSPGTPPPRRRPRPPASPAANSRRCGRVRRHLGAGGQPPAFPAARALLPRSRRARSRWAAGEGPTAEAPSAGRGGPRTRRRPEIAPELSTGWDPCCVLTPEGGRPSASPLADGAHQLASRQTLPAALGFLLDSGSPPVK